MTYIIDNPLLLVPQGCDKELIPKGRAVGFVIEQTNRGIDTFFDSLANDLDGTLIRTRSLQKAAVSAQDLVQGVPRQVEKALTDVDNGIVRQCGIGNGKVLLRSRERRHFCGRESKRSGTMMMMM